MPAQVFISHTTLEKDLAIFLKDRIERDFLGLVSVFVSSDQASIEAGEPWLEALRRALKSANMEIILCSPNSITKPWVNFEAGAAWLQNIPVVPLCHSGLRPEALPMPLASLQGGESGDPLTYQRLYGGIAKLVPCSTPAIDMSALANAAKAFDTHFPSAQTPADSTTPRSDEPRPVEFTLDELFVQAQSGDKKAFQLLAASQCPEAFAMLTDLAVNQIDNEDKIAAIKALATFRSPGDITPICELLVQDRWQVAEACAKALARFKNSKAIPYLIKASDQHVDWITTQQATTALGIFAPAEPEVICPALIRALELGSFEGEAASQSLRRYGSAALPYLLKAIESDTFLGGAEQTLKTIALIGDKQALPGLQALRTRWFTTLVGQPRDYLLPILDKSIAQIANDPLAFAASPAGPH
jgi:TIR domain/PBS lyase HEAT-like repeat